MITITDKSLCSGCGACCVSCPDQFLQMTKGDEGFSYPGRQSEECLDCNRCQAVCPTLRNFKEDEQAQVYACRNKHEETRSKSTSGGVFSLLAEHILDQNGIVFGATWDSEWNLVHDFIDSVDGLDQFRGAKYVQSETVSCFPQVKSFLEDDQKVLFSGTSCQIAGLRAFLQREYDNLLCVGIVCHSVPSPKVFRMYRDELQVKYCHKTQRIEFRRKSPFWRSSKMRIQFETEQYEESVYDNMYTRGFFAGLYSRPSCHHCRFKLGSMRNDITLGDFWGIERCLPEMDDNRGTSLVLLHTKKARTAWEQLINRMTYQAADLSSAVKFNPYLVHSVAPHHNREQFFQELGHHREKIHTLIEKHLTHQ